MKPLVYLLTLSLLHAQEKPSIQPQQSPLEAPQQLQAPEPSTPLTPKPDSKITPLETPAPTIPTIPTIPTVPPKAIVIEEAEPATPPELSPASDPAKLFQKGYNLGRVGDRPTGSYRRLIQRTVMIGEPQQAHRAILTFDDQILPTDRGHSSAMDIAKDLQKRGVRAIFFANVPAVSEKSLKLILRRTSDRAQQKEQVLKLLNSQRAAFITGVRELLKLKKDELYICEVFNHTAFHQNMSRFKKGSSRMEMCFVGIRFIEECLEEAYAAERPGIPRLRYFRFPFLAEPRDKKAKTELDKLFTEFGLISLGETQDSKDFDNGSSTHAYKSLKAAKKGKRYGVRQGAYGIAEQPIALFHTKTWSKIRKGVLKFLDEHPTKPTPASTPASKTASPQQ